MSKYQVFLSKSIETFDPSTCIGNAVSYQDACQQIDEYLNFHKIRQDSNWRVLLAKEATFIDFGSWSTFAAIVPPVDMKELVGEE